jgi:hypothetical protein
MIFEGQQGELVRFYTPKARQLIQRQVTLVTKQRLSAQCVAQAEGSEVIQDVHLGNSVLDQYITQQRLDTKGRELCEGGLVCGAWFTETTWRTDKGAPYTRGENGAIIYTGSIDIQLRSIFDVFYDMTVNDWTELTYVETRCLMNRYDLIAQHPELESEILALPSISEAGGANSWYDRTRGGEGNDDNVYVYKCFAKPSAALPNGRMIIYGDERCVFYDDENLYKCIPVEPFMPEKVLGVGFGYPQISNLLAAQEMYDNSLSAIATNQAQFAVQSVTVPRGSNINVNELNGMRFVSFTPQNVPGGGKPEPLQLTQSSPETFKFSDVLSNIMQELSMVSPTTPPPGITSGVAIATMAANSVEFISGMSTSYITCWEKTLEHAMNFTKMFAKIPQKVSIKGRNSKLVLKDFKGEDIAPIAGVKIQMQNPLMQTIAGRIEIAEKLMQMPREMWPQYVSILEGEPLTQVYKGDLSQNDLIVTENELLRNGKDTPALASDDHGAHAKEHAGLLNDPAIRINGQAIQVILDHIAEHEQLAKNTDPFFLAMVRTGKVPDQAPPPEQGPKGPAPDLGMPAVEGAQPAEDMLQRGGQ